MSNYDDLIRKAQKEIEKLTADIEKKKTRITELKEAIKKYEARKVSNRQLSAKMITTMEECGIDSEADREAIMQKMQEYIKMYRQKTTQDEQQEVSPEVVPDEENELTVNKEEAEPAEEIDEADEAETEQTTDNIQTSRSAQNINYQNSSTPAAYPYRQTNNGHYNS